MAGEYMTVREVAELLGFPANSAGDQRVRRLIRDGKLIAVRISNVYYLPRATTLAYAEGPDAVRMAGGRVYDLAKLRELQDS